MICTICSRGLIFESKRLSRAILAEAPLVHTLLYLPLWNLTGSGLPVTLLELFYVSMVSSRPGRLFQLTTLLLVRIPCLLARTPCFIRTTHVLEVISAEIQKTC